MIRSIKLKNWKAFNAFNLTFSEGVNFLIGPNAIGKTSILEALCLAFTGNALTVSDPKILTRAHARTPSEVIVEFEKDSMEYRIERSLSKKKLISSKLYLDRELIATSWNGVTKRLTQLMGLSASFFERVLYLSEGDIFRFIRDPPRKGIAREIEEALGIDRMENLLQEISNERHHHEEKQQELILKKSRYKKLAPKGKERLSSLRKKNRLTRAQLVDNRQNLQQISVEIGKHETELSRAKDVMELITSTTKRLTSKFDLSISEKDLLEGIKQTARSWEIQIQKSNKQHEKSTQQKGMIQEQAKSLDEILNLLAGIHTKKKGKDEILCPVCRKKLSLIERKKLLMETRKRRQELDIQLSELNLQIEQRQSEFLKFQEDLGDLRFTLMSIESFLAELKIKQTSRKKLDTFILEKTKIIENLASKREELEQDTQRLDTENSATQQEIQKVELIDELENLEDLQKQLTFETKSLMALNLLEKATHETIKIQREKKLEPVYKEIESVWNKLRKGQRFSIKLDSKTIPTLYRQGVKFDAQQLSGGEKVALFVILRTVLCRRFTKIGFMLLDEPLEHLDWENRRLIVDFLVESLEKGWIDQLIVTTFEEHIIRKFSYRESTRIITL